MLIINFNTEIQANGTGSSGLYTYNYDVENINGLVLMKFTKIQSQN